MTNANQRQSDSTETSRLLARASAGDHEAIQTLFKRHLPAINRTVDRRLGPSLRSRVDPSDVVQDTQHAAYRRLDDYLCRRPMPFRLWLLRTAHERLVDLERAHLAAQRSVQREVPIPDASSIALAQHLAVDRDSPSQQAIRRETCRRVRVCLAELPENDREILMLRVFEGLSNRETALILDLNPETTKKRFTRALLRLQKLIGDEHNR